MVASCTRKAPVAPPKARHPPLPPAVYSPCPKAGTTAWGTTSPRRSASAAPGSPWAASSSRSPSTAPRCTPGRWQSAAGPAGTRGGACQAQQGRGGFRALGPHRRAEKFFAKPQKREWKPGRRGAEQDGQLLWVSTGVTQSQQHGGLTVPAEDLFQDPTQIPNSADNKTCGGLHDAAMILNWGAPASRMQLEGTSGDVQGVLRPSSYGLWEC